MRFPRLPSDLRPNALARARAARGVAPYDLTVSNPTACGIPYPHDLLEPLRDPAGLHYRPDPRGLPSAREAVAREYAAAGVEVDPQRIVLVASSSEAYGMLFKLLCAPGDAVLVPVPSYPLFEHLASLEGVRAVPYQLDPSAGWQPVAPRSPDAAGARAAILVHPNNPTGSFVERESADRLTSAPWIVDEVFLDFPLGIEQPKSYASRSSGLTFALGGLSKSRGLPQLKLSWIVVGGPVTEAASALEALEFISDNYLSVGAPVQAALPEILRRSAAVRAEILARCRGNLAAATLAAHGVPGVELLVPGGGWSCVLRYPHVVGEEALVLELLEREGVAVHPGYFFDFPSEGYLVASLLPEPALFREGFARVLGAIAHRL